ncbi:hypothetical protein P153DRAFT_345610 [Dothidotthia symphoricarpi CBS 119687]|uniref:BRCT domain-containing protein n=1 Tax=Dothidotthia symphoricarpi CBS 119687 TaxID=1392245 RepID=A0A6A6A756_9PLEO|nr:uncharacterized protein P153DRAFT_345610 [Dothidotthia symphoricarpi CBS 119687]KAF2126904.1 hypothetical protein P153DRAFT_345610 [Dothidotthia symphoricarpi CBS 119687]
MGILSRLTITAIGTLAQDPTQLKKWTEANGGKWVPRMQKGVTHLIASKDAWKKRVDAVQQAADVGAWVVSYDWLEDSLQKRRKLAEKKYTWEFSRKEGKKRKELKRMGGILDAKKFNDGCVKAREATGSGTLRRRSKPKASSSFFFGAQSNTPPTPFISSVADLERRKKEREALASVETPPSPQTIPRSKPSQPTASPPAPVEQEAKTPSLKDLYHYYLDSTGFEYKITLVRSNLYLNNLARYQLCILETHTKPHAYCTLITYTPPAPGIPVVAATSQPLKQALLTYNNTNTTNTPSPEPPTQTQPQTPHPEAARLLALTTPPIPPATTPYKALLTPLNSPFAPAFHSFRTAFRDLTLLRWEERFDPAKTLQKARAKALCTEPFVYARPAPGMPDGRRPQGVFCDEDGEGGYVRNSFGLPGLVAGLGREGVVGRAVLRDLEEGRRVEEREEEKGMRGGGGVAAAVKKKSGFRGPLFNGVAGRPKLDSRGRYCTGGARGGVVGRESDFVKGKYWGYEE